MDGNPGVIPDNVGAILLILRGRIRIFPAHWRNRFAVPLEPFGLDLSCNRKYVARNDVTPIIALVSTITPNFVFSGIGGISFSSGLTGTRRSRPGAHQFSLFIIIMIDGTR